MNNCCYNHPLHNHVSCNRGTTAPRFEDVEELRGYIIEREANRKLSDIVNVADNLDSFDEGVLIAYNSESQLWDAVDRVLPIYW